MDVSYALIDKEKRKAKQSSEEKETSKRSATARLGEQFLIELLQIDLAQKQEDELF